MYTYAHNNPILYNDPSGHFAFVLAPVVIPVGEILVSTVVAVAGAVTGYFIGKDKENKNTSGLPNQGKVSEVYGAPAVDAGKQGKHVPGHPNDDTSKSQWNEGETGVMETQEAWENGKTLPDGTKVWDIGSPIGSNGETGVRVHIDGNGNIHGYPVNPDRYLK